MLALPYLGVGGSAPSPDTFEVKSSRVRCIHPASQDTRLQLHTLEHSVTPCDAHSLPYPTLQVLMYVWHDKSGILSSSDLFFVSPHTPLPKASSMPLLLNELRTGYCWVKLIQDTTDWVEPGTMLKEGLVMQWCLVWEYTKMGLWFNPLKVWGSAMRSLRHNRRIPLWSVPALIRILRFLLGCLSIPQIWNVLLLTRRRKEALFQKNKNKTACTDYFGTPRGLTCSHFKLIYVDSWWLCLKSLPLQTPTGRAENHCFLLFGRVL